MEFIAVLLMLASGAVVALLLWRLFVSTGLTADRATEQELARDRDHLAASILLQILTCGGVSVVNAMREIHDRGIAAEATPGADVVNWAGAYARVATREQSESLLDLAVSMIIQRTKVIPLRQYVALLDLSFGLGFHTNALARLRLKYGFDYIDHARDGRPREADRAGAETLFARDNRSTEELLRVLGLEGSPTRPQMIAAYRRLASEQHPDRFFAAGAEAQSAAAARFIEITRAYEALMAAYRD